MPGLRLFATLVVLFACASIVTASGAQTRCAESRDMALTGFHDLQGRGATGCEFPVIVMRIQPHLVRE
jgi:hypothetical protein